MERIAISRTRMMQCIASGHERIARRRVALEQEVARLDELRAAYERWESNIKESK